jgi:hypothetical protein
MTKYNNWPPQIINDMALQSYFIIIIDVQTYEELWIGCLEWVWSIKNYYEESTMLL